MDRIADNLAPSSLTDTSSTALQEKFTALYDELRRTAARELRRNTAVALSATTLLHETFLNLSPQGRAQYGDEAHFMAYAAKAMRGIIIDHIRNRRTQKRGGQYQIISLPTEIELALGEDSELEFIGDALDTLSSTEPRLADCVDLRFFCGFSLEEIARIQQVSERTVRRDWDRARLLLRRLLVERRRTAP